MIRGAVTINTNGTLRLEHRRRHRIRHRRHSHLHLNITGGTLNVSSTANQTLGNCTVNLTGGAITASSTSCNLDFYQEVPRLTAMLRRFSTISTTKLNLRQDNGVTFTVADGAADIDLMSRPSSPPQAIQQATSWSKSERALCGLLGSIRLPIR